MKLRIKSLLRLAPLALVALPFAACSSNKNYDERRDAAAKDPNYAQPFDASKYPAAADYEAAVKATCIGTCKADPGSTRILVDGSPTDAGGKPYTDVASAEKGYQFAWLWDLQGESVARSTFTYDDNTPSFVIPFRTPSTTHFGWGGWEPVPDMVPAGWAGPTLAARFRGGEFTEYGGGIGISLRTISNALASVAMPRTAPGIALLEQTPSAEFPDPTAGAYDVSSYEGMAVWVRRGPDGQSSMRLAFTERNSAEDLNSSAIKNINGELPQGVFEGKYCKRWRLCGCAAGTPCSVMPGQEMVPEDDKEYRCFDPAIHTPTVAETAEPSFQVNYPHCGRARCKKDLNSGTIGPDPDPAFMDKQCNPAIETNGHSEMFCYDPDKGDPQPPTKRQRCSYPFSRAITVSTDWQLIKVPFAEMRQADEGPVAGEMDLHSLKQVAMTFTGGWIDYWINNIGFYRKQP